MWSGPWHYSSVAEQLSVVAVVDSIVAVADRIAVLWDHSKNDLWTDMLGLYVGLILGFHLSKKYWLIMYRSRPHFSLISSQTSPCLSSFRSTSSQTSLLPLSSLVTVAIYSTDCAWLLWYLQRVALLSSASVSLLSNKCCSSVMSLEMLGYFLELQQCIFSLLSAQLHKKFR